MIKTSSIIKKGLTGVLAASVVFASAIHGASVNGKGVVSFSNSGDEANTVNKTAYLDIEEQLSDGNTVRARIAGSSAVNVDELSLTSTSLLPMVTTTIGTFQPRLNKIQNDFRGYEDFIDERAYKTGVGVSYSGIEGVDLHAVVANGILNGSNNDVSGNMELCVGASLKVVDNLTLVAQMSQEDTVGTGEQTSKTSLFAGYEMDQLRASVGIDNTKNVGGVKDVKNDVTSIFAAYEVLENLEAFVRYGTVKFGSTTTTETTTMSLGLSRTIGSLRTVLSYSTSEQKDSDDKTAALGLGAEFNF